MQETIDVERLMRNVQEQLDQGSRLRPPQFGDPQSPATVGGLSGLTAVIQTLRFRRAAVGRMPATPPTFRGRCGRVLVGMVRRSLFWLLEQLDDFHTQILEASDRQLEILRDLESTPGRLAQQIAELHRGLAAEMAAREEAERVMRVEIAHRQALASTIATSDAERQTIASKLRRLEIAIRNQQVSDLPSVGARASRERPLAGGALHIGICGTFDVLNYGDLLFPLLAEHELKQRLGDVVLQRFSYNSKMPPGWPYEVISVSDLPDLIRDLDGLLIGGGLLVRFDKDVAPGYIAPDAFIHHPTGYWLSPALLALQHDVPLVWNAPGMHKIDIPEWASPLLDLALGLSPYVSVRDELSRAALQPHTLQTVAVAPDTAFGLPNLLKFPGEPTPEYVRFARAQGLERPYIVFQPNRGFEKLGGLVLDHPEAFSRFQFLVLPISPEFKEYTERFEADIPGLIRVSKWLHPLLTAELIGRSEAAVGNSYHFAISALVAGVPVFRRENLSTGKFTGLQTFDTVFVLPADGPNLDWFLARIGRRPPSAAVAAALERVCDHWDRIARAFLQDQAPTAPVLNRFWQSLPGILETLAAANARSCVAPQPDGGGSHPARSI